MNSIGCVSRLLDGDDGCGMAHQLHLWIGTRLKQPTSVFGLVGPQPRMAELPNSRLTVCASHHHTNTHDLDFPRSRIGTRYAGKIINNAGADIFNGGVVMMSIDARKKDVPNQ